MSEEQEEDVEEGQEDVFAVASEMSSARKFDKEIQDWADRFDAAYERKLAEFNEAEARWKAQYESLVKMYDAERSENGVLRDALDMCRNSPNRLVCKKFSVDQYFWGHLPEMVIILHRAGYPACLNRDDYLCELVIGKAPVGAMAFSIATDAMMRLMRFAATGNEEGKLNELQ